MRQVNLERNTLMQRKQLWFGLRLSVLICKMGPKSVPHSKGTEYEWAFGTVT